MQMLIILCTVILVTAELLYFKIADHYNIIDKPNHRSSHTKITIRGGGIVFPLSVLLWFIISGFEYPFFVAGLMLISAVSFIDDIKNISRRVRTLIHIVGVSLVFYQLQIFSLNWLIIVLSYIIFIGIINAYNFMDGINGITGSYSIVVIGSLLWINQFQLHFIDNNLLFLVIISLFVFNFFNFRNKAVCFAGDIGSISIALIICFLLAKLIIQTSQLYYILILTIYGIDAIYTIIIRISARENIFEAHRKHLYQIMVNQLKYPHLTIAILYSILQLLVNVALIIIINTNSYLYLIYIVITLSALYFIIRLKLNSLSKGFVK